MKLSLLAMIALLGCGASSLPIERVVLYQNGIGYFERTGDLSGDRLTLHFAEHEVDDALKTLTVLGEGGGATVSASVPARRPLAAEGAGDEDGDVDDGAAVESRDTAIEVVLGHRESNHLEVSYAVPVPVWRVTYRVVLGDDGARLQAWALVHNASAEDWRDVHLTLATNAPFSFATDLGTPRFVARPDASGRMIEPVAVGLVESSRGRGVDRGQGARRATGPDTDGDRILDSEDQCPSEPETYNGMEDGDGCPDRGRVVIEENNLVILERIYFAAGSSEIGDRSRPIVDAIAATLQGNPQIARVTIEGHVADNESNAWALSAERGSAVVAALVARGVAAARLQVVPFGATRPVAPERTAQARERNRRVEFRIEELAESTPATNARPDPSPSPDYASVPRERVTATLRHTTNGSSYEIPNGVFVPAHSTAVVSLVDRTVEGEEILLHRPDPNARGSRSRPFRAVRFANGTDATLVPGPVALFARGRFVGEGLLDGLGPEETAFIPYAVDSATRVRVEAEREFSPMGIVSLVRGMLTFEDRELRTTRYLLDVGTDAPARIIVHHPRRSGYDVGELPPGSEEQPSAVLALVPFEAGVASVLEITETRAVRRRASLVHDLRTELDAYVANSSLDPAVTEQVQQVLELRSRLRALDTRLSALRQQSGDATNRTAELRANVSALDAAGRRRSALRGELQGRLEEAAAAIEALGRQITELSAERASARVELSTRSESLSIEQTTGQASGN